jgi:predicted RND superfamily exporter protein
MWQKLANGILRNRLVILILLGVLTAFMGYQATFVELQYEFGKLLPENDSTSLEYDKFRNTYGQDGLVIVVSTEVEDFYTVDKFSKWHELGEKIKALTMEVKGSDPVEYIHPIDSVFSEALLYNIVKDKENHKFELKPLFTKLPSSQSELDSLRDVVHSLPFYEDMIYKDSSNIHLMMIFVNEEVFNSKNRGNLVGDVQDICEEYNADFGQLRYSGLPFVRSITMKKVKGELGLFVFLAILVVSIVLFVFYRSFKVVFTSLIVVVIGVVWSIGTMSLFGYQISILMGLMPPLMIVIGIPNCVYLITKYQQEY